MKKFALSFAALALTAGSALAADLPSRKGPPVLPPPPPPPLWTGFYVGLNAGGGWASSNSVTIGSTPIFTNPAGPAAGIIAAHAGPAALSASGIIGGGNNGGFIGGGQIGYNYQFYNNFLVGIEADIQGVAASGGSRTGAGAALVGPGSGATGTPITTSFSVSQSLDYIGTVRGRLGWLATPTLLVYGTGGLAYGGVSSSAAYFSTNPAYPALSGLSAAWGSAGAFSDTRVGWTAGGGVEWMFMPNWSAKVEYLYFDLGSVTYNLAPTGSIALAGPVGQPWWLNASQVSARFNGNIVRAGANYHFNWAAAPVVAKY
ncbi:outer membrane protein [Methylocystis parvus]|uniref:Porin family protein n=1 Tax=Methylocystis parvus TaxID=134 RepID=A0A6B8M5A3_9HYPH|nr:outer membrane beta-barrel protein [Methylocystis parvus]QGM99164.1 porin family protein [Methylocystis parvus]WBK00462.1 outer membrane beta-barrel protein [Methylocystis parvus OBBP]